MRCPRCSFDTDEGYLKAEGKLWSPGAISGKPFSDPVTAVLKNPAELVLCAHLCRKCGEVRLMADLKSEK
jgi:hypothetical protein